MPDEPTLLRALITSRHWQKFATFETQFRRAAVELAEQQQEPALGKVTVSPRQWERWYAGKVKTAPHPGACRVLEHMFGYSVQQLLAPASWAIPSPAVKEQSHNPASGVCDAESAGLAEVARLQTAAASPPAEFSTLAGPQPRAWPVMTGEGALSNLTRSRSVALPDELAMLLLHPQPLTALGQGGAISAQARDAAFTRLVQFLTTWAHTMQRRELLRILGWATTAAMASPALTKLDAEEQERVALALQVPSRVDASVIEHSEAVLWRCMRQDDALGPQAALDTVLAQRNLARAMLPECQGTLRPRLLSLFSNLSRFAGWLSFDLGDFESGWYFYEQARSSAHEAENNDLAAFVLCNMSHLATWQGKARVGIDHAVAAQGWAKRSGDLLLQAYASDVAARAFALNGQRSACLTELGAAGRAASATTGRPGGQSLVYFYGPGQFTSTESLCLLQLGDADQAAQAARTSLGLLDGSFVRNIAFCTLHLADAHVRARDVDQAAQALGDAGGLVVRNRSARLMQLLHAGRRQLAPWHGTEAVRTLDDRLAAYGLV